MFKKPSRTKNIRRRIETEDDDDPTDSTTVTSTVTRRSAAKKKDKKGLALSFEEENENDGEEFKVKKSNASVRLASERKLRRPGSILRADMAESTEEVVDRPQTSYTDELIASLRAETPSLPSTLKDIQTGDDDLLTEKFPTLANSRLGVSGIPDANTIHAAKKKREQMRKGITPVDEDFVALDDRNEHSRLVREEDDFADDGEEEFEKYVGERMSLDKRKVKMQEKEHKESVRDMIKEAQDEDEDEDDEDLERWEQDLIRHGGARNLAQGSDKDSFTQPTDYRPALIPDEAKIPTMINILGQLDLRSNELTENLALAESQSIQSTKGVEREEQTRIELEEEIGRSSKRYDYFQELVSYVNDLGEFLDEKIPLLEELEKEAHGVFAARHVEIITRRWWDDIDDLTQFVTIPEDLMEKIHETEPLDTAQGQTKGSHSTETAREQRKVQREQRLGRRPDLTARTGDDAIQQQGLWSDDDMPEAWITESDMQLQDIQDTRAAALFANVDDKFGSLRAVKDQFEAWKREFRDDYDKAYGALSLPGAFEFYVRCELVRWDPFSSPLDFHEMEWHKVLSEYGVSIDEQDEVDLALLKKVVEKVLVKKIKAMADTLNAASSESMENAAQVMEQVSFYFEKHNADEYRIYKGLTATLEGAVQRQLLRYAELLDAAVPKAVTMAGSQDAKKRFAWRQIKYINNLYHWRRDVPTDDLHHLGRIVLERSLGPILRPTDKDEATLLETATASLSRLQ